ncbi:MAG: pirin family protein [bacterium]|nr:pirin family protein [bacterium]
MIRLRKAADRGYATHGWLETYFTFSFADYRDPAHVHFRALRVMNDDKVAPKSGFGMHPHDNMEIITYVMEGELTHQDSLGNQGTIRAGEFQMMHAGRGIRHAEKNDSDQWTHLYQIWLFPDKRGHTPGYDQRSALGAEADNKLNLIASAEGRNGSIQIHQDASLYLGKVNTGKSLEYDLAAKRHAWVQVTKGGLTVNGIELTAGDGAAISDEQRVVLKAATDVGGEFLLFDLA